MCAQDATPWSTGTAGTYYFFDEPIAAYGRAYAGGVLTDVGADPLGVVAIPSSGSMTVRVKSGSFRQSGIDTQFLGTQDEIPSPPTPATHLVLTAADPLYPRIDYVSIWLDPDDTTPHLEVTAGIPDNSVPMPLLPIPTHRTPPVPNVVLAIVIVYAGMTEVLAEHIYDRRFFLPFLFTGNSNKLATAVLALAATPAGNLVTWNSDRNIANSGRALTSVGDLSGPAAAVDGEVALYDGVTGKLLKRGTGTGPARLTSGVLGIGATNLASEVTGDLSLANVMPAAAGSTLLGRGDAGAGDWQAVALGTNLAMSGTTLNATGGSGGAPTTSEYLVGAVDAGLSAERVVTNTPSITWDLATAGQAKAARAALTGDVTAAADANATTIAADAVTYAKLQNVSAASRLLGRGDSGSGDPQEITLGANLTMTGTTLAASGGSGAPVASAQGEYNTNSTEQTLLSYTIPGGTLGTAGGVLWYLTGRILANSGTNNWTLRIKLGATTLLGDVSATITNGATRRALTLWGMVFNNGSASVQLGTVEGQIGALTAGSIAGNMDIAVATTATFALVAGQGSGSEDTTTDKVFAVTGQFSVSNVAVEFTWKAVAYLI